METRSVGRNYNSSSNSVSLDSEMNALTQNTNNLVLETLQTIENARTEGGTKPRDKTKTGHFIFYDVNLEVNDTMRKGFAIYFQQLTPKVLDPVFVTFKLLEDESQTVSNSYSEVKAIFDLSKKLNKPMHVLTQKDLEADIENTKKVSEELIQKEEEKPIKKSKRRKKRQAFPKAQIKTEQNKNEVSVKPAEKVEKETVGFLNKKIIDLNSPNFKSTYILDARVKRWGIVDVKVIRDFEDYDFKVQKWVKKYEKCSEAELQNFKVLHNLSGIERIISDNWLKDRYSFPYQYITEKTGEVQNCRGFFALKKVEGQPLESGILHIGINKENHIFHALFDPLKEEKLSPERLVKNLGDPGFQNKIMDESWTLTTHYSFSLVDSDIIEMTIGKSQSERVTYLLYPI